MKSNEVGTTLKHLESFHGNVENLITMNYICLKLPDELHINTRAKIHLYNFRHASRSNWKSLTYPKNKLKKTQVNEETWVVRP